MRLSKSLSHRGHDLRCHHVTPGVSRCSSVARAAPKETPDQASKDAGNPVTTQTKLGRVAHQGCPGAFTEVAALRSCPGYEPLPCEQFEVAFQALTLFIADRAVQPIENSLGGSIHTVYDLLLRYRLHIVGETSLGINHCLCALPGTRKADIKKVMSHPQALAQCDGHLRKMGVAKVATDSTATASQMVSESGDKTLAAISSSRAAELYGLEVVEKGIQDLDDNVTRFVVLAREPLVTTPDDKRAFKTSIVFSLGNGSGQLFKALAVFALRDLDLLKIESRPVRNNPMIGTSFNYLFYVDFMGKLGDVEVQNAMRNLEELAPFVRVLGSFPMDMGLGNTNVETMIEQMKERADAELQKAKKEAEAAEKGGKA